MGLYHATYCKSIIFWGLITVPPRFILCYINDYSFELTPIILCKPSIKISPEILLRRHQVVKYSYLPSNIMANRNLKIVRIALYYYQMYASILRLLCN